MKYWQPKYETMDPEELKRLQLKRLQHSAKLVYDNVPFYRQKFKEAGVTPEDIKTLEDVRKLPFTRKTDLRDNYPFGLFAAKKEDIVRIHASSGTSGKPTVVGYTAKDIETWSDMIARSLTMIGLSKGDTIQNSMNYGLFTGGLGFHYGVERMGSMVVPAATGNTARQLEMMIDFGVTAVHCTPSYAFYLAETAEELDLIDKLSLKAASKTNRNEEQDMNHQLLAAFKESLSIKVQFFGSFGKVEGVGRNGSGLRLPRSRSSSQAACGVPVAAGTTIEPILSTP